MTVAGVSLPAARRTVLMFHFVDVNERYWTVVERGNLLDLPV